MRTFLLIFKYTSVLLGWFGIRKNFSQFLLCALPFLQEYGNISYHTESASGGGGGQQVAPLESNVQLNEFGIKHEKKSKKLMNKKMDHLKPVVPIISIDLPD